MFARVEYKLQAYMADNDAGAGGFTRIRLRLVNAHRLSRRRANPKAPQSTYVWALDDRTIVGLPDLDSHQAAKVFAIALSVQSRRVLHSPVILNTVTVPEYSRRGPSLRASPMLISPRYTVDERFFVEAATALKAVWGMSGDWGRLMRAAINAYWDALHAVQTRSRFLSLYAALELLVNALPKEEKGGRFDKKAAGLAGASPAEIQPLRDLNNRLKHAKALRTFGGETMSVGGESRDLKGLVDQCIATRCSFSLPTTHSR
jgi:hypothetical protein